MSDDDRSLVYAEDVRELLESGLTVYKPWKEGQKQFLFGTIEGGDIAALLELYPVRSYEIDYLDEEDALRLRLYLEEEDSEAEESDVESAGDEGLDESEIVEQTAEDESDEAESDEPTCQYCDEPFHPKGLKPHERHCPENPANQQDETDEDDSDESNEDPAASVAVDGYRCLGCGESFGTERGARVHQGRSRDCTGAEIEPVEQTDTSSESAGSAADPTGDTETPDDTDETEANDDPALDPAVGAVPIDPETVDEAVVDDDAAPDEPDDGEQDVKQRVRREPSTVREVLDAAVPGTYLCMDCGFLLGAGEDATAVRHHDFRRHERYTDENGDAYRQLADVPDDALAERWLVIYKNVGSNWTHPKLHEARKNGIVAVLEEAEYFLDVSELLERLNELLQVSGSGQHGRRLSREQLTSEPGYLDELVEEGRIEQDGKTWGVDARRAAEIVEATA